MYGSKEIMIPFPTKEEAERCKGELDILATIEGYVTVADLYHFSYPGRWKCGYDEWHYGWSKEVIFASDIHMWKDPRGGDVFYINLPVAKNVSGL